MCVFLLGCPAQSHSHSHIGLQHLVWAGPASISLESYLLPEFWLHWAGVVHLGTCISGQLLRRGRAVNIPGHSLGSLCPLGGPETLILAIIGTLGSSPRTVVAWLGVERSQCSPVTHEVQVMNSGSHPPPLGSGQGVAGGTCYSYRFPLTRGKS